MGDYAEQLTRNGMICNVVPPIDLTIGAQSGRPVSLKGWDHLTVIAHCGAIVAGTSALTLTQDVAIAPTADVLALGFTAVYTNEAAPTVSTLLPVVVVNTEAMATTNAVYVIEVDADSLTDVLGATTGLRYDCVRCELSGPGNNDLIQVTFVLTKGRYAGPPADMKDVYLD